MAPEDILSRFLYEPDLIANDCEALKKQLHQLHRIPINERRLAILQSNIRLRAWLMVNEPSMLLLNGRADPRQGSEISQFSVMLLESLQKQQETQNESKASVVAVIPLAFFCGQHRDWQRDPNANPEEAAMSLMLQFIDRYQDSINLGILRQCYEHTNPGDLASICDSFESLVMTLESNVIVVLILDGLRHFTQPRKRREKTRYLISRLVGMYRKPPRATFKLLLTSPTRSDFVEDHFEESELLNLPRDLPASPTNTRFKQNEDIDIECLEDYTGDDSEADP